MRRLLPLLILLLLGLVGLDGLGRQRQQARGDGRRAERARLEWELADEGQQRVRLALDGLGDRLSVLAGDAARKSRLELRRGLGGDPRVREVFLLGTNGAPRWPRGEDGDERGAAFRQRSAHLWPLREAMEAVGGGELSWLGWVHDDLPALLLLWPRGSSRERLGIELNQASLLLELQRALEELRLPPGARVALLGPTGRRLVAVAGEGAVPTGEGDGDGGELPPEGLRKRLTEPLASVQIVAVAAGSTAIGEGGSRSERWLPLAVGGPLWGLLLGWIWWSGEGPLRRARSHADLIAQAGHQCATPLQGIALQAELARRGLERAGEEAGREAVRGRLERIEEEAARLGARLRDLQASARSRPVALRPEELELGAVLDEVRRRWQAPLAAAGMELRVDSPPRGAQLRADGVALAHVLDNLLENARVHGAPAARAGEEDEEMRVELRVRSASRPGWVALELHDSGAGIAPPDRRRVLRPWVRLEKGCKLTGVAGSGLGLAVVARLVRACGWTLELGESSLGGLLARIELPGAGDDEGVPGQGAGDGHSNR